MTKKMKSIEKRVYSVVLKGYGGSIFLWLGTAFTLDEALSSAKEKARTTPSPEFWSLILHENLTLTQINNDKLIDKPIKQLELPKIKKESKKNTTKNELMQKIINTKDAELFQKKRRSFNKDERMFLEEKLKKSSGK